MRLEQEVVASVTFILETVFKKIVDVLGDRLASVAKSPDSTTDIKLAQNIKDLYQLLSSIEHALTLFESEQFQECESGIWGYPQDGFMRYLWHFDSYLNRLRSLLKDLTPELEVFAAEALHEISLLHTREIKIIDRIIYPSGDELKKLKRLAKKSKKHLASFIKTNYSPDAFANLT